ncbi:MAG: SRPBCC domain-containing protein [Acidimicrobiales bacterium]
MTVIEAITDDTALSLRVTAQFAASPEKVWEVWENPRLLERWWGPPTWPATFTRHDFVVGGESRYYMTGPDGDKSMGYWKMRVIDEPRRLEFANGLAGDDGEPSPDIAPMGGFVTLEAVDGGTRMTVLSTFDDEEHMRAMIERGMSEGMQQALGQIDALLH